MKGKLVIIIIQTYCNANNNTNSNSKCIRQLSGLDIKQLNTTNIIKMNIVY
jgi:hypothetical protein